MVNMNIGQGLIHIPFALLFLFSGVYHQKRKEGVSTLLMGVGIILSVTTILLLTELFDPYSSHIL